MKSFTASMAEHFRGTTPIAEFGKELKRLTRDDANWFASELTRIGFPTEAPSNTMKFSDEL